MSSKEIKVTNVNEIAIPVVTKAMFALRCEANSHTSCPKMKRPFIAFHFCL